MQHDAFNRFKTLLNFLKRIKFLANNLRAGVNIRHFVGHPECRGCRCRGVEYHLGHDDGGNESHERGGQGHPQS